MKYRQAIFLYRDDYDDFTVWAVDLPENEIGEIAYALGYGDSNYFSTVFQREKGCPPSAYRKRRGEQPPDQA